MTPSLEQIAEKLGSALANIMSDVNTAKLPLGTATEASEALDLYITWRKDQGKL